MKQISHLLAGVALLAGCAGAPTGTDAAADTQVPAPGASKGSAPAASGESQTDVNRDLATLRQATARFQRFDMATDAGWSTQITGCMVDPDGAGGMGFHYGNTTLIDGSVQVDQPELLLYEPEKNGRMRLVAVEYIIPYTLHARDAAPPVLFGQNFQQVDVFQLWGLHAWVWKNNPSGMFAQWNPDVTCEHATTVSAMSH